MLRKAPERSVQRPRPLGRGRDHLAPMEAGSRPKSKAVVNHRLGKSCLATADFHPSRLRSVRTQFEGQAQWINS
ncbi:hypothetical protein DDF67_14280 [Caulobacter endophyticus]|uniref:Uncharacterized protein n=1 Tax=Caulobacter endophyticus TaxID=2172652 RepID=A0A2T9JUM9_9CAUL|nr:hypothetical protein DDF67_14280 [Caulobacter endophyticus]